MFKTEKVVPYVRTEMEEAYACLVKRVELNERRKLLTLPPIYLSDSETNLELTKLAMEVDE